MLGFATLWALRVNYGNVPLAANSTIVLTISIIGWVLVFLGVSAVFTPIGMIIAMAIFGMSVSRFRNNERRALLWTLSLAAEKKLPLYVSARAFAARRSDEMARRALALADLLESGMPLTEALAASGNPIPRDTELMVRLSLTSTGKTNALAESGTRADETEQAWMPVFGQIGYLMLMANFAVFVITFIMIKIIPTYKEIFIDFGTELPAVTMLTIAVANWFASYGYLFAPIFLYIVVTTLIFAFFYARGQFWFPPPLSWLMGQTNKPTLFRALKMCIEQELPMVETLRRLARDFPDRKARNQLANAAGSTAIGVNWCEAMQQEGLVSKPEMAVLKSAMATNSLTWALRELAEVSTRNMIYRARMVTNIGSAIIVLLIGAPVALISIGCFIPLVSLIQNLT